MPSAACWGSRQMARWAAAAMLLGCCCVASAPDVVVFRHGSADVDPKAPQPTGKPPTCFRNPTTVRIDSPSIRGPATLLAVTECRFWAGDGCHPNKALPAAVGVGGPWPEPTRGCSRLSTDSGASWAPLVHNVTGMGALDMQAVFLPGLNKVMLAFNRHNPRHIDDDHVLWFRLGSLSAASSAAASRWMVWDAPVSVQQRLVRPANSAADAWWAACPGPGRATILRNPKAPHIGRIMLAVYQEGIKGNSDWDPGDCRNPNFTSPEGDWAAGYYSDDNGSSWHVSRTQDPLGPWADNVFAGMSEPTVTQLANGSVRMDFRQGTRRKECACRMFAISNDGGASFGRMQFDRQLISPECQGSMLEWGGSLYFSNPRSTTARTNMSVLRSDNDGASWSSRVAVSAAGVATSSSCLVELPTPGAIDTDEVTTAVGEATVGLMYERGTDDCAGASCEIVFTTLPPSRFAPLGSIPLKSDDTTTGPKSWTRRHMALADRGGIHIANLSNVIGCVGMGWNTDHHHCPWNSSASAQPNNNSCIAASPAEILTVIQNENRSVGLPVVFTLSEITDPTIPGHEPFADHTIDGYYLPFLDSWVQGLKLRVTLWFTEYKRLGGTVDVLLLDFEACDYLNAGRMAGQSNSKNETEFGSEIVKQAQWPSLRAELEQLGEAHGAKFTDTDMAQMKDWGRNQTDFRQYVWNAVVVSLTTARALNSSIVEPMLALFPDAHISNYAHKYVPSCDALLSTIDLTSFYQTIIGACYSLQVIGCS